MNCSCIFSCCYVDLEQVLETTNLLTRLGANFENIGIGSPKYTGASSGTHQVDSNLPLANAEQILAQTNTEDPEVMSKSAFGNDDHLESPPYEPEDSDASQTNNDSERNNSFLSNEVSRHEPDDEEAVVPVGILDVDVGLRQWKSVVICPHC